MDAECDQIRENKLRFVILDLSPDGSHLVVTAMSESADHNDFLIVSVPAFILCDMY